VKPKTKHFGLFLFVSVFQTYIGTTAKKRTVSKQTKTVFLKIPKYNLYQTVSVGLLFVSGQSNHRNSLFWYRTETPKTNVFERNQNKLKET
jgi:hypothetical protein